LRHKFAVDRVIGALFIKWRHLTMGEFPDDFFPNRGMHRGVLRVEFFQDEAAFLRR
jgi:hypothetical protein